MITLYPWPEEVNNLLSTPASYSPQDYFRALYEALHELQKIVLPIYHITYHPDIHYATWQIIVNTLLLLEKWHLLLTADPSLWLHNMPIKTYNFIHSHSLLIIHVLARLRTLAWNMIYIPNLETPAITLPHSILCAHSLTMTVSAEWHAMFAQDRTEKFTRIIALGQITLRHYLTSAACPLTPTERLNYAAAWQQTDIMETLLDEPYNKQLTASSDMLTKEHPFYIALIHSNIEGLSLLWHKTAHAFPEEHLLQLCITHHMLHEIPTMLQLEILFSHHLWLSKTWKFYAVNGLQLNIHNNFLTTLWLMAHHHASFSVSKIMVRDIFLALLLRALDAPQSVLLDRAQHLTTQTALLCRLKNLPFWLHFYESLPPQTLWEFFDFFFEKKFAQTTSENSIPTIHTLLALTESLAPLPLSSLFAQLTETQWEGLCEQATAHPHRLLAKFLIQNPVGKSYIERKWRQDVNHIQARIIINETRKKAEETPLIDNCDPIQKHLMQTLCLKPTSVPLTEFSTSSLFEWTPTFYENLRTTTPPDIRSTLYHLNTLCTFITQDNPEEPSETIASMQSAISSLYTILIDIERWAIAINNHPTLFSNPHALQYQLHDLSREAATQPTTYPGIVLLRSLYVLARLPWDKLQLDIRNAESAFILPEAIQRQLAGDIPQHFNRVMQHLRNLVHSMLISPVNSIEPHAQIRLSLMFGLEDQFKFWYNRYLLLLLLPSSHEWSILDIALLSGHGDYWLAILNTQSNPDTTTANLISDGMQFLLYLFAQHVDFGSILLIIGAGWISPALLLQYPPHAVLSPLNNVYENTLLLESIISYLVYDPLKTYSTDDLIRSILWICSMKPAYYAVLNNFFDNAMFTHYFNQMNSECIALLCHAIAVTVDVTCLESILSRICIHLTPTHWEYLLSEAQFSTYPDVLKTKMQHLASRYHTDKSADQIAEELIAAETATIQRKSAKKLKLEAQQKIRQEKLAEKLIREQTEKKTREAQEQQKKIIITAARETAHRAKAHNDYQELRLRVAQAAAEKGQMHSANRLENFIEIQSPEIDDPIENAIDIKESSLPEVMLPVALSPTESTDSMEFLRMETSEDSCSNTLDAISPLETPLSTDTHIATHFRPTRPTPSELESSISTLPIRIPPFLRVLQRSVPTDWPLLIPGHATPDDREWHLWLIVPASCPEKIESLPHRLWNWHIVPHYETCVYVHRIAYQEVRFSCFLLPATRIIQLTITRLQNAATEVPILLRKHLIGFTATRFNLHNGEWYLPYPKAQQDLQEWMIDFLNPTRNIQQYPYSPTAIAYAIKVLFKFAKLSGYRITMRLQQFLYDTLQQPQYQTSVPQCLTQYQEKYPGIWEFFHMLTTQPQLLLVNNPHVLWPTTPPPAIPYQIPEMNMGPY